MDSFTTLLIAYIATARRQEDKRSHRNVVPAFVSIPSLSRNLTIMLFSAPSCPFLAQMCQYSLHYDCLTFYPLSKVKLSQSTP